MGFPIGKLARRAAFIGAMIGGGLLAAGIAQAQAQDGPLAITGAPSAGPALVVGGEPTVADRQAELIAAVGGPAPVQYLMNVAPERPAVDVRDDDVEGAEPDPADALNAAEAVHDGLPASTAIPGGDGSTQPLPTSPRQTADR